MSVSKINAATPVTLCADLAARVASRTPFAASSLEGNRHFKTT